MGMNPMMMRGMGMMNPMMMAMMMGGGRGMNSNKMMNAMLMYHLGRMSRMSQIGNQNKGPTIKIQDSSLTTKKKQKSYKKEKKYQEESEDDDEDKLSNTLNKLKRRFKRRKTRRYNPYRYRRRLLEKESRRS